MTATVLPETIKRGDVCTANNYIAESESATSIGYGLIVVFSPATSPIYIEPKKGPKGMMSKPVLVKSNVKYNYRAKSLSRLYK